MTTKVPGIKLTLGGKELIVPPLSLGAVEDMQDRLSAYKGVGDKASVATAIDALTASLKRNYPETTREEVRELIGLENMQDVMLAVMDVSGLRRQELESGEPAAKPETAGSTSPASTPT
jgi:hypothetical protein